MADPGWSATLETNRTASSLSLLCDLSDRSASLSRMEKCSQLFALEHAAPRNPGRDRSRLKNVHIRRSHIPCLEYDPKRWILRVLQRASVTRKKRMKVLRKVRLPKSTSPHQHCEIDRAASSHVSSKCTVVRYVCTYDLHGCTATPPSCCYQ
ncbi:hypothetical protein JAAARDRAFT_261632 [Jaapia argillacea MUCL 33604]|uniref:Uncharacterized protein n=1 Tax=Jaapia argillacea MUCL 33604 TaxID=933084 RepID=A0A067PU38_9AGAM|nr:hypothetical protein JAAARDRAFT_261632 [Jaapia argillacea MUCL 33604]